MLSRTTHVFQKTSTKISHESKLDSEILLVWLHFQEQGIEYIYIELMKDMVTNSSMKDNKDIRGEVYGRDTQYCPSCLFQHFMSFFEDD